MARCYHPDKLQVHICSSPSTPRRQCFAKQRQPQNAAEPPVDHRERRLRVAAAARGLGAATRHHTQPRSACRLPLVLDVCDLLDVRQHRLPARAAIAHAARVRPLHNVGSRRHRHQPIAKALTRAIALRIAVASRDLPATSQPAQLGRAAALGHHYLLCRQERHPSSHRARLRAARRPLPTARLRCAGADSDPNPNPTPSPHPNPSPNPSAHQVPTVAGVALASLSDADYSATGIAAAIGSALAQA